MPSVDTPIRLGRGLGAVSIEESHEVSVIVLLNPAMVKQRETLARRQNARLITGRLRLAGLDEKTNS
jgi:hypothetical protein